MNNRLLYGALGVIIELLFQIAKHRKMPAKAFGSSGPRC